jgi:hypothetical protein
VVVLLILAVVGGTWWKNTRQMDFMTPPSEAKLQEIRVKVESSFPRADQVDDAVSIPMAPPTPQPPPAPVMEAKPPIDLGNLRAPLALQNYGELSPKGAEYLIELASALESQSEPRRSLLAWERVLDLSKPDEGQRAKATAAIKRLRSILPDWNAKPETAAKLYLRASSGKKLSKPLAATLESVAAEIERASSGIVKIKTSVAIGKSDGSNQGAVPIALWLTGPDSKSSSTEVLSFKADSADTLRNDVLKTVYLLIQNHLSNNTAYTPPAELSDEEDPLTALSFGITRLGWSEFAAAMNIPLKKPARP